MDLKNRTTQNKFRNSCLAVSTATLMSLSGLANATSPTSGQLVLINSLGVGMATSTIIVTVNDATGPCSTTSSLAFNGVIVVPWNLANTHSTTKCTGITSVDVSALKTVSGVVSYDSTANTNPPATSTAPTSFIAPTTPINNLVLIITGETSPAMVNSATSWGSAVGVAPVFSITDGSLVSTGIMGAVGSEGLKASKKMLQYGVMPAGQRLYSVQ